MGHIAQSVIGAVPVQVSTERSSEPEPLVVPGRWRSIEERLDHLAATVPLVTAVEAAEESVTYADFVGQVRERATALRAEIEGDGPIAFPVVPGVRCLIGFFAMIVAGRPAVPLDPMLPSLRREQILADSGARLLAIDEVFALPAAPAPTTLPQHDLRDPAVIFYTSGSSGNPKGVVHCHGSWLNQAFECRLSWRLQPAQRHAFVLPMSFGAGLDSVFMTLLTGGTLVVHDPRVSGLPGLIALLRTGRIDSLLATPALLAAITDALHPQEVLTGLRLISTSGEAIHSAQVERVRQHLAPGAEFMGSAGASEIGNLAFHRLRPQDPVPAGILPVGTPAANKRIEVLDADGRPVGPGVTGEVVITSSFLSLGYWQRPEQTAERFTGNADGTVSYRGGDLGRWSSDGVLHLRGRADAAVKVAGYLVEPAEVEAALLALPGVSQAVVSGRAIEHTDGSRRTELVAHLVPLRAEIGLSVAAIRRGLRDRLPSWMVPTHVVVLPVLPRTERGKVDRQALPLPTPITGSVAPTTATEHQLVDRWRGILGLPTVFTDADFWALGGDSLAVEELFTQVQELTGIRLTSHDLVAAPTIGELGALLDLRSKATAAPRTAATTVRLRTGTAPLSVFFFAGGGAPALSMRSLAAGLTAPVAVHGFQAAGYERPGLTDRSVDAVVRRHLRQLKTVSPTGPYLLLGHSFGGLLALETAARLAAAGDQVPLVVLLDTRLPGRPAAAPAPQSRPPLGARLAMHARLLGAGLIRYRPEIRDAVFWEQSLRMANRHRPRPWPGSTLVFTAPENTDDPSRWDQLLTGTHEVTPVDGGHSALLRPPFDRPILDRLDAEIAAVLASGTP